jgi:hypothetical protein
MIRKYALIIGIVCINFWAKAQITITVADMPNPSDSIVLSLANTIDSTDVTLTGANYSWDYSKLIPTLQRYELFDAPSTFTSPFNLLFNPFNTSYGRNNYQLKTLPLPGMKLDAAYDFFKESTADYRQIGAGYTINGTPIPFLYSPNDIVYRFPMNYLNQDSCDYKFGLGVPTMGYYGQTGHRVNTVDGWGTLITPFGTFATIRVLSAITAIDTVYIDAFKIGTNIPRPLKHEYKWFAQGSKIPLLQIDANVTGGTVTVTAIQYQDSLRSNIPHVGIKDIAGNNGAFEVYPNPAQDQCIIKYLVKGITPVQITVSDISGKMVFSSLETKPAGEQRLVLKTGDFSNGIYFVRLQCERAFSVQKLVIAN